MSLVKYLILFKTHFDFAQCDIVHMVRLSTRLTGRAGSRSNLY
jgi:hypothetical protein